MIINNKVKRSQYFKKDSQESYLEIGPLDRPFFKRDDYNIYYLDYRTTEEIKEVYKNSYAVLENIVDIDFPTNGRSYRDSVNAHRFDAVYSRHCAEHTFDIIGHLQDVSEILAENGIYYMKIPDVSCWFDYFRTPNTFWEAYNVHMGLGINSNIADSWINTKPFYEGKDKELFRNKSISFIPCLADEEWRIKDAQELIEKGKLQVSESSPHIWTFSKQSSLQLIRDCLRFNLIPLKLIGFTGPNEDEDDDKCSITIVLEKDEKILNDEDYRLAEIIRIQIILESMMGEAGKTILNLFESREIFLYGNGLVGKRLGKAFEKIFGKQVRYVISDDYEIIDDEVKLSSLSSKDEKKLIIISSANRNSVMQMKYNLIQQGFVEGVNFVSL